MSKTLEVTYGLSILMGEHWEKISVREQTEVGDTMESVLDDLNKKLLAWHEKRYPNLYRQGNKPQSFPYHIEETEKDNTPNYEWEVIKLELQSILFQEDAQEFINTTKYFLTIEAKKIINQKPLKIKK